MINPASPDYTNTPVSAARPRFAYIPAELVAPPCATIITPFYNTGPIFHETAQSVMQQSLQQWEWLIINDGSTDPESVALLDHYRHRDPRIRVIDHEKNMGLSAARNTGFRAARAPYVVQLDSDDLLEPTAVEKWVWFLESYPEFAFVKGYGVGFGAQTYLWNKGFHNGSEFLEENIIAATSAIRKSVHQAVGGYDETIRGGLEDWDFWLRCANAGHWGGTLPEYLDWYRRRVSHGDRWTNWGGDVQRKQFREALQRKYPHLWKGGFPQVQLRWPMPNDTVPDNLPWENRLGKAKPRLLLIAPWLTVGGADKFNLDMLEQLTKRGWEITIATTLNGDHSWLPAFAKYTPDIFILHNFLRPVDHPRFLRYLLASRNVNVVLITNSDISYMLLPYLRAQCPQVAFVDFCHMEEEQWRNGGYPRRGVEYQKLLDLNVVASQHLQQWMVKQGANPQRIRVCYINVDPERWRPVNAERRTQIRRKYSLPEDSPLIAYVGRIGAQKRPQIFAEVVYQLVRQKESFTAVVLGDGPDFVWLQAFVKNHNLGSHVRLLGAVPNEQVCDVISASDIFFLPSAWEGIALSIYEAMACGVVVVGADVGGQRELVTPECGILIARSNDTTEIQMYAEALTVLLRDQQRRIRMGSAGRQRIEESFRLSLMGERIEQLLQEAMRLHSQQPRSIPTRDIGQICANQAVEYSRLSDVAEGLWRERAKAGPLTFHPHLLDPHSDSWRTLAYFTVRRMLLPYYQGALDKQGRWLRPMKDKLKRTLLGQASTSMNS